MCLTRVGKPRKSSGVGWKAVWPTKQPDVFKPAWAYYADGNGLYCHPNPRLTKYAKERLTQGYLTKVTTTYKLNKTHTVDHNHTVELHKKTYSAGIYLHKTRRAAYCEAYCPNGDLINQPGPGEMVVIKCSYNKAVACDDDVVVAMEVTPLKVERKKNNDY